MLSLSPGRLADGHNATVAAGDRPRKRGLEHLTPGVRAGTIDGMNLCVNGHDRDVLGANKRGDCLECKRIRSRVFRAAHPGGRARPCVHDGECQPVVSARGQAYCAAQRRLSAKDPERVRELRAALAEDGWEDLAGPVEPLPAGYTDWVAEARKAAEDGPERRERATRLHSSSEGAVGSSVKTHGSHYAVKGRKTGLVVYGR